ncbi:MAG: fused MFS/spermidine synthase [Kyrpidia tusciae]|nr:fused MFS/spermidine synthase [Kyrpidia tusciae]MBE3551750.1 fused MFS/spermidine synthase [Kyrpidia tusciae]
MKPHPWMYAFVFVTGAAVMTLEMAASRFAAPFFGTSQIVWANIIGLIMIALSLGYWLGGRLADRYPRWPLLFAAVGLAGLLACAIPWTGPWVFHQLQAGITGTPIHMIVFSFFGILIMFAPPVFLLAMVSPFVLRLSGRDVSDLGKVSGALYAWSTVGSIAGTFVTAFVLIPRLGTHMTIVLTSGALIFSAAMGLTAVSPRRWWWSWLWLLVPLMTALGGPRPVKPVQGLLFETETAYQYVQVVALPDGSTALIYNEGGGVQSLRRPEDALVPRDYYSYMTLLPYLSGNPSPDRMEGAVIGAAGGTILHLIDRYDRGAFPGLRLEGVEIDPVVAKLGPRYFGLNPARTPIRVADGRAFVTASQHTWDFVVVDAYSQQIYIPFHLATKEFFSTLANHLTPRGVMAFNVNAVSPDSPLLLSLLKTVQEVFPHFVVIRVPDSYNYLVIAGRSPLHTEALRALGMGRSPVSSIAREALAHLWTPTPEQLKRGMVLTDDRAPVEYLTDSMIWDVAGRGISPQ